MLRKSGSELPQISDTQGKSVGSETTGFPGSYQNAQFSNWTMQRGEGVKIWTLESKPSEDDTRW